MSRHAPALGNRGPDRASSWFRSAEGRRYLRHFGGLIALKVALLAILYFVFVAPQPRADTSPDGVFDAVRGAHRTTDTSQPPREPTP